MTLQELVRAALEFAYQKGIEMEPITDADIDGWTQRFNDKS